MVPFFKQYLVAFGVRKSLSSHLPPSRGLTLCALYAPIDTPPPTRMNKLAVLFHQRNAVVRVHSAALLCGLGDAHVTKQMSTLLTLCLFECCSERYKYLLQFLYDNVPEAAEEIRVVYIESMGRTISALFRAYHAQLLKLEVEMASRHDLIAVEVRRCC